MDENERSKLELAIALTTIGFSVGYFYGWLADSYQGPPPPPRFIVNDQGWGGVELQPFPEQITRPEAELIGYRRMHGS